MLHQRLSPCWTVGILVLIGLIVWCHELQSHFVLIAERWAWALMALLLCKLFSTARWCIRDFIGPMEKRVVHLGENIQKMSVSFSVSSVYCTSVYFSWPGSTPSSQRAPVRIDVPRGFQKPRRSCDTVWSWPWPPPSPQVWQPAPSRRPFLGFFDQSRTRVTRRWSRGQLSPVRPGRCDRCRCQSPHWCLRCPMGGTLPPLSPWAEVWDREHGDVTKRNIDSVVEMYLNRIKFISNQCKHKITLRTDPDPHCGPRGKHKVILYKALTYRVLLTEPNEITEDNG